MRFLKHFILYHWIPATRPFLEKDYLPVLFQKKYDNIIYSILRVQPGRDES